MDLESNLHQSDEFLSDIYWVVRRLSDHEFVLFLVDEHVMREQVIDDISDVLDGVVVLDATLLNRVLHDQMLRLLDSLLTNVPIFLVHTDEYTSVSWLSEHHGHEVFRRVIVTESRLEVTSTDINDKSFVIFFHLKTNLLCFAVSLVTANQ